MTVPAGSAFVTAVTSALSSAAVAARLNWYSSRSVTEAPSAPRLDSSPGVTQAPAVLVTELARPTTVSTGWPGRLVTVKGLPSGGPSLQAGPLQNGTPRLALHTP